MLFDPQSIQLTSNGHPVRLHLFSTGRIASRLSNKWEPIWVLVIDHPEGLFLVDTGIRIHITPCYYNILYKFDLDRDQEIDRQLANINIETRQIKTIILTHRHFDHTGGLGYFPQTPIAPTDFDDTCGPFTKAHYLTKAKDLAIVPTPGHTRDHCSVLLKTDTRHILFAGDTTENRKTAKTYVTIKAYAQLHPLTILLTHDPGAGQKLKALESLPSSKTGNPPPPHP
jgi:glyoxylase-like metal-dependent hydrolase (beta-lactamase superfamily II)